MHYGLRFMTLYRRQGSRPSPWKRNAKRAKWLSEEALQVAVKEEKQKAKWLSGEGLQIAVKRREVKAKEKRKDISI